MKKRLFLIITFLLMSLLMFVSCSNETTIEISDDGYWVINGEKTDVKASGEKGDKGDKGEQGLKGDKGDTPTIEISDDGYWVINGEKTDVKASGEKGDKGDKGEQGLKGDKGDTPTIEISDDGYWVINGVRTENKAAVDSDVGEETGTLTYLLLPDGTYGVSGGYSSDRGNLVIPSTYNGAAVTAVLDEAFRFSPITSVTIPDSVISIGSYAFYGCTSLISVTIGNGVTLIGSDAFTACSKLVEVINKSTLDIEAGSSSYGDVGYYALEVHSGNSQIVNKDNYLFYTYNGTNYLVGGYVGNETALTLPSSYNGQNYEIYKYAFYGCNSLNSVTIPDSVTSIGELAFFSCGFTSITVDSKNEAYKSIDGNLYTKDGKTLIQYAIGKKNTSFTIPDSVISIGYCAFYGCNSLISVTIGNGVTSIGSDAFTCCSKLVEVIDNSAEIAKDYFGDALSFRDTYGAFEVHSGESKIVNEDDYLFYTYNGINYLLGYVGNETAIILPSSYNGQAFYRINRFAFYNCAITSVIIPDSVFSIGENAFYGCYFLNSATFENAGYWRCQHGINSGMMLGNSWVHLSFEDLADAEMAAIYLRTMYCGYWERDNL